MELQTQHHNVRKFLSPSFSVARTGLFCKPSTSFLVLFVRKTSCRIWYKPEIPLLFLRSFPDSLLFMLFFQLSFSRCHCGALRRAKTPFLVYGVRFPVHGYPIPAKFTETRLYGLFRFDTCLHPSFPLSFVLGAFQPLYWGRCYLDHCPVAYHPVKPRNNRFRNVTIFVHLQNLA